MIPLSPGRLAILLGPDLNVSLQLKWAYRLAGALGLDILVLQPIQNQEGRVVEVSLTEEVENAKGAILREIRRLVEEAPLLRAGPREKTEEGDGKNGETSFIHVRLKRIYFPSYTSLRRSVLAELGESKVECLTSVRKQFLDMSDLDLVRERRFFFRYVPCKVVLCQGIVKEEDFGRILLVAEPGPSGRAALKFGLKLAASGGTTPTVLEINPDVGVDAKQVGERRLDRLLKKILGTDLPEVNRRVVVSDKVPQAIRQVYEESEHDLVVVGAPPSQMEGSIGAKLGKTVKVAIVMNASPVFNRFREFIEEGIQRIVPQIEREDRIALVDRVQSSAAWNFDFIALMVLSTIMAAIGLVQNSAAIVIGAMLVAPLMTPLMGLGLALVQNNRMLARLSLRSVVLGLGVSLFGGFLVGTVSLGFEEPTREMLARGGPEFLDLCVAFVAGLAAAYASSRPGLIAALPGVAIAAALVPPIATSGLAFSLGDYHLALNALLLFGINMVTIVLAAMTSLWVVGLRNLKKTPGWTVAGGIGIISMALLLGLYLSFQPMKYELTGKVPEGLVEAVQMNIGKGYRFDSLAVAYDEIGVQLNVLVEGQQPAPESLATEVRTLISDYYDQPVRVRLLTRIKVPGDQVN